MPISPLGSTSYDQLPYESLPFFYTRPEYLSAIGLLFGMRPPGLAEARILELGAASGGSLISFATRYPNSRTLGIDLSNAQIKAGRSQVQALGLKNLELKAMSLMEIDASFGQFDYIICHGVYSWVPKMEQAKILEIAARNLSPNGIAFISYNTLPGWNQMASLREMLQFHTAEIEDLNEKLAQARLFLGFVGSALEDREDPHSRFLTQEIGKLEEQPESYLLHEFLIGENQPFYFVDFMKGATAAGLTYLADAHLATMNPDNLSKPVSSALAAIPDILKREQYLDFIENRRFRCTLLTHQGIDPDRNLQSSVLDELFISMNVSWDDVGHQNDQDSEAMEFRVSGGKESVIIADDPLMKAVMLAFAESNGRELTLEEMLERVQPTLPEWEEASLREELRKLFLAMISKEVIRVAEARSDTISTISERPKVSDLVRLQVLDPDATWVCNQVNEPIAVSEFGRLALRYLNGERTRDEIVAQLITEHAATGELVVEINGAPASDEAQIAAAIESLLSALLEKLRMHFLLIA